MYHESARTVLACAEAAASAAASAFETSKGERAEGSVSGMRSGLLSCRCHARVKIFQAQEELFGFNVTEYASLEKLQADYAPFHELWTTCGEFVQCVPLWQDGSLLSVDAQRVASDCARCALRACSCLCLGVYPAQSSLDA